MRSLTARISLAGRLVPGILILLVLLSACLSAPPTGNSPTDLPPELAPTGAENSATTHTPTPFQPITATPTEPAPPAPTPTATASPAPTPQQAIWLASYLPAALQESFKPPQGYGLVDEEQNALLRLQVGDQNAVSRWVYALVAPFSTIPDEVSLQDLRRSWRGEASGPFAGKPILVDERTQGVFSAWWGEPSDGAVRVLDAGRLLERAWEDQPAWAIIPFEALEPRWVVLKVDGQTPLAKDLDLQAYPLTVPFSLQGDANVIAGLSQIDNSDKPGTFGLPATNRDPGKLTTVAMTGVTALVRATAFTMRRNGVLYPDQDVREILRQADIAHVSNEIPFTPDCPPPNPQQADLRFCSDPAYMALLEDIGTDVVELTGDHFGDWGPEAMLYTLGLYDDAGWVYYGGGKDRNDARAARTLEHNGNRIAFIGCNGKGGGYATASESQPGAVACDFDWMTREISRLTEEGYLVIATFQHFEYYTYYAQPDQVRDFRRLAEAGAAIVSGSQAHQPQGMEFFDGTFIHYGLGNLFFDQYQFCTDFACDDGFIDRHVFYDGRYISTELLPIKFIDFARPRPMTQDERVQLLQKVFFASGW